MMADKVESAPSPEEARDLLRELLSSRDRALFRIGAILERLDIYDNQFIKAATEQGVRVDTTEFGFELRQALNRRSIRRLNKHDG